MHTYTSTISETVAVYSAIPLSSTEEELRKIKVMLNALMETNVKISMWSAALEGEKS